MKTLLFADRDGVIIHNHKSLVGGNFFNISKQDIQLVEDAQESLYLLYQHKIDVVVVTNQAYFQYTPLAFSRIVYSTHEYINEMLGNSIKKFLITDVYEEGIERAIAKRDIMRKYLTSQPDYDRVFMVGDSKSDIQAGSMIDAKTIYIPRLYPDKTVESDYIVDTLLEAAQIVVGE
jgi:histidinol phosphatase-like enzyme